MLHDESLALAQEIGDKRVISYALRGLGVVAYGQGDYARATNLLKGSLTLAREVGEKSSAASALYILVPSQRAYFAVLQTPHGTALQSLSPDRALGRVAHAQGDDTRATLLLEESLVLCRDLGAKRVIAGVLEVMAHVQGQTPAPLERAA